MYQVPQRRCITKDSRWVTVSDLKIQAVKEICYEVALNDFRHSRQEIEALAIVKMKELCATYGKKDPNERDSWRGVARDVWDTVGAGDERMEDTLSGGGGGGVRDVDDLKVHIDKLEDILLEVKKQNNMKDEEIRALRHKMVKMEKVLPLLSATPEAKEVPAGGKAPAEQWGDAVDQEERASKLMGDDDSFRRGRVRWMRQEQSRLKNLQQQEISRQLRRQPGPHRFIPPEERKLRFPFRSNPKHRSSWSPGTHIIITDDQVIELKVPKEALQEEEEPEGTVFMPPPLPSPSLLRKGRESEHRGQGPRNGFRAQPGRARSSSFNSSRKSASPAESSRSGDPAQPGLPVLPPHQSCQAYSVSAAPPQTPTEQPSQRHQNHLLPPPRLRRQLSAPNLKAGRETPV